jgi:hypothetical protein
VVRIRWWLGQRTAQQACSDPRRAALQRRLRGFLQARQYPTIARWPDPDETRSHQARRSAIGVQQAGSGAMGRVAPVAVQ